MPIRGQLCAPIDTEGEVAATDKRVRFVGFEAYEAAGGAVRRDLFDQDDSGTIIDVVLLNRLVAEKLAGVANQVRAEGWAWVEVVSDFDRSMLSDFRRAQPVRRELTGEEQARSAVLAEEYDALADSTEADDGDEAVLARLGEIEDGLDAIEQAQFSWPSETLAVAGAVVTLAYDGSPDVLAGLIRCGDEPEPAGDDELPRKTAGISAALVESLTAEKSSIVSRALADNPAVALAAVVHALALPVFYRFGCEPSCLQITLRDAGPGCGEDDNARHVWTGRLPEEPDALWAWCLAQSQDTLLALLAYVAGESVDAVRRKADPVNSPRIGHADALARALKIDMAQSFTPGVENYFSRISGTQIVAALCEARGVPAAPSWSKMRKADLAAFAAREIAGTGWLPEAIRLRDESSVTIDEAA